MKMANMTKTAAKAAKAAEAEAMQPEPATEAGAAAEAHVAAAETGEAGGAAKMRQGELHPWRHSRPHNGVPEAQPVLRHEQPHQWDMSRLHDGTPRHPPPPPAPRWARCESRSVPGRFYWVDSHTGRTSWTAPPEVGWSEGAAPPMPRFGLRANGAALPPTLGAALSVPHFGVHGLRALGPGIESVAVTRVEGDPTGEWELRESRHKPGKYYYFNRRTQQRTWRLKRASLPANGTTPTTEALPARSNTAGGGAVGSFGDVCQSHIDAAAAICMDREDLQGQLAPVLAGLGAVRQQLAFLRLKGQLQTATGGER